MEFSATNPIVRLCLLGLGMGEKGQPEEAKKLFLQAWNESTHDLEKFIAAHHVARRMEDPSEKLDWLLRMLEIALKVDDDVVKPALQPLYTQMSECYEALHDTANARRFAGLAESAPRDATDQGPFFHGTKAVLKPGDVLKAGFNSNYKEAFTMNHVYFTALANGAGLAAALARGDGPERVYLVEPTGTFENDPNVTNKKFPGNPTRSYRTASPVKITAEVGDWKSLSQEEIQKWREKLSGNKGEIIN